MGYDIDRFVNLSPQIADNFKCSICLDIFEAPLELPCGHIFCLECIKDCFGNSVTCECPECRKRVQSTEVKPPNRKLLCVLQTLNIKCEFADEGCSMVLKVENLITHTRECQFNTTLRPSAPTVDPNYRNGTMDSQSLSDLLAGDADLMEHLERLHQLWTVYSRIIDENEFGQDLMEPDVRSDSELIQIETPWKQVFCCVIGFILFTFLTVSSTAAIVISSLKLHSCSSVPTLPRALLALGISLFLSVILESTRKSCYEDKFCVGLKFIQSVAFGSLIYLAVVVYSNLDYTVKNLNGNSLSCDVLLFEFSFWFTSSILAVICIIIIISILYVIFGNLRITWSEWEQSFVLLSFFYIISFSGIVISISSVFMGSFDFDYCPAIPSLTTKLIVFGTLNFVCCLTMLLNSKFICFRNPCFWMLTLSRAHYTVQVPTAHERLNDRSAC